MKRILFVDDEPRVLDGLKRMLYPIRNKWEMVFATSGKQALELLANSEFDLLITDMSMAAMTGIDLLHEIVKRHPQLIRIVLSGTADEESTLRSATLAHQYLVKPCDAETLRGTIERAFSFRVMLDQPALKQLVSRINRLPSVPSSYGKLLRALRNSNVPLREIGKIVASDVAMTAKILQLVNSAFFGLRRHIGNPTEAVVYLGLETVKALTLTVSAFSQFERTGNFCVEELQTHSVHVGMLAKRVGVDMGLPKAIIDNCFTGGLLHDVGKLVLNANYPDKYAEALLLSHQQQLSQSDAERKVLGASHAEVGGYLLWLWGLPDPVIEAVLWHHGSADAPTVPGNPATIVEFANALVNNVPDDDLNIEVFRRASLIGDLKRWRQLANEVLTRGVDDDEKDSLC